MSRNSNMAANATMARTATSPTKRKAYTNNMFQSIIDNVRNTSSLSELVAAIAAIDALKGAYEATGNEVPESLTSARKRFVRQIDVNRMEENEARRKELQSRLAALATPDEKRAALKAELAKLDG
jgi:hypothetical protein